MANLVPFNRGRSEIANIGFRDMLDDFFAEAWPFRRNLMGDTFKVDVQENEGNYYVLAELPGVKREEISVWVEEGRLTISVARDENTENEDKNYIHRERRFSSMQRNIFLSDAESEGITAKLVEGILRISIPKRENKKSTIDIEVQ